MFPYDPALLSAVRTPSQSIADVLGIMQIIEATCIDADGLKWFNWLYLQVTQAVETHAASAEFGDPAWLAELVVGKALLVPPPDASALIRLDDARRQSG